MARDFNGSTSRITGTVTAINTGDWTIGAWMNADGLGEGSNGQILAAESGGSNRQNVRVLNTNAVVVNQNYSTTAAQSVSNNSVWTTGVDTCVIATFNTSDVKSRIYIGTRTTAMAEVSYASGPTAGVGTRGTGGTQLGIGDHNAADRSFDGRLSRVFLVPRLLTADEMERFRLGDWLVPLEGGTPRVYALLDSANAAFDIAQQVTLTETSTANAEDPPIPWGHPSYQLIAGSAAVDATATPSALAVTTAFPAATLLAVSTTTPAALAVPVSFPAATLKAVSTTTPAAIAVPISFPQATATASHTATPGVISIPITLPTPTLLATATTTPAALAVPITIPSVAVLATSTVTPGALLATVTFPAATLLATATITPAAIAVPVTFPAVAATGEGAATAQPDPIAVPVTFPAVTVTADATATPAPIAVSISFPAATVTGNQVAEEDRPARGAAKYEPVYPVDAIARVVPIQVSVWLPPVAVEDHHDFSTDDEELLLLL